MAGGQNWPIDQSAESVFKSIDKRLGAQERRAAPRSATSVVGPGLTSRAVQILDWNSEETAYNGFFWSIVGALHSPDDTIQWTGQSIAKDDGSGLQQVWNLDPDLGITTRMRTWVTNTSTGAIEYGDWRKFATPSGMIGESEIDQPVLDNIQDALDNAASAITFAEATTKTFRQATAPVSDTSWTLRAGDQWFDTDDQDRPYIYDGSAWILLEQAAAAAAQAAADAAHAEAMAAAADAATAITNAAAAQDDADSALAGVSSALAEIATKSQHTLSSAAPTTADAGNAGDVWERYETASGNENIIGRWRLMNSASPYSWQPMDLDATYIPLLDIGSGTFGSLNGERLLAKSVGAGRLVVADFTNLISDPKMLNPATWYTTPALPWSIVTTTGPSPLGTDKVMRSPIMSAAGTSYVAHGPTLTITDRVPVKPGDQFYMEAYTRRTGTAATAGTFQMGLWFYDSTGAFISNISVTVNASAMNGTWTLRTLDAVAPANAAWMWMLPGYLNASVDNGQYDVTDAVVRRKNGGELFVDGSIDGRTVTGALLQTTATANAGVKFTTAGITAYNASSQPVFTVLASTGAVTITGPVLTGGTITGPTLQTTATASRGVKIDTTGFYAYDSSGVLKASISASTGVLTATGVSISGNIDSSIVTGGTVQTTATASRGIKLTSTGLVAYDSVGTVQFTLDAGTGTVTMKGTLTSGSTITGATVTSSSFSTATSGQRVVVNGTAVSLYQGLSGETAASVNTGGVAFPRLYLQSGTTATYTEQSGVYIGSSSPGNSAVSVQSGGFYVMAAAGGTSRFYVEAGGVRSNVANYFTSTLDVNGLLTTTAGIDNTGRIDTTTVYATNGITCDNSGAGGGFTDGTYVGGGSTTASVNNNGRIIRTSTKAMKKNIKPMTRAEAHSILGAREFTGQYRKTEHDLVADPRTYPFFLAEQAAEDGAELWVARQHDVERDKSGRPTKITRNKQGKPIAFRTGEVTVAHNYLIRELFEEIASLKEQVAALS